MGLMDKVRGALERATEKMDEIGQPDPVVRHEWPEGQPWAVLVESEWRPGARLDADSDGGDLGTVAFEKLAGVPYRFVLDVRRPDLASYRIEQRVRIPSRVQHSWLEGEVHVPSGSEVPLRVTGPGPEDVEIDWDGYLAMPGRKQEAERLRAEAQWDAIGREFERRTKPEQVARIRAANRQAALAWADAVRAGQMSRAQFDQSTQQALRTRQLLPEHLEEALARLDG